VWRIYLQKSIRWICWHIFMTCAAERQCIYENCDSCCKSPQAVKHSNFKKAGTKAALDWNTCPCWRRMLLHLLSDFQKVNGWRRSHCCNEAWTQNRYTNNIRFVRFVNLFHFVSEVSHLLQEGTGLRNFRSQQWRPAAPAMN